MQWYEILIIVLAAAFVVGVITRSVLRKKKGKSGCGCDCGSCGGCSACASRKEAKK